MANMKMAHDPNVEILGAPIGDVILCDKFLSQMRVKAVPGVGGRILRSSNCTSVCLIL